MNNFFNFLWKFGIYILLIFVLYIVIIYKVKYEGTTEPSKYLYFYKCGVNICTTTEDISGYKSRYKCDKECPLVMEILDEETAKLKYNNVEFKYNYITGERKNEE